MEICQMKPYSTVGDYFMPLFHSLVDIKLILIYCQQLPLDRDMEFKIKLLPGTAPISRRVLFIIVFLLGVVRLSL